MARMKGPKKTNRYPDEFKIKAVQLACVKSYKKKPISLFVELDRIRLPLQMLLFFYIPLNRVRMTIAKLSTPCNSLTF